MKIVNIILLISCFCFVFVQVVPSIAGVSSLDGIANTEYCAVKNEVGGVVTLEDGIDLGRPIGKGDRLFRIDNSRRNVEAETRLYDLENQLANTIAERRHLAVELDAWQRREERMATLVTKAAIPRTRHEDAETEVRRARDLIDVKDHQIAATQAAITQVERQLDLMSTEVGVAPCTGVVWSIAVNSGEYRENASTLLMIMSRPDIHIEAYFSEEYAERIRPGTRVEIEFVANATKIPGSVDFVRGVTGIDLDTQVEVAPDSFHQRRIVARIAVDTTRVFGPDEFYGVGRHMRVKVTDEALPRKPM